MHFKSSVPGHRVPIKPLHLCLGLKHSPTVLSPFFGMQTSSEGQPGWQRGLPVGPTGPRGMALVAAKSAEMATMAGRYMAAGVSGFESSESLVFDSVVDIRKL